MPVTSKIGNAALLRHTKQVSKHIPKIRPFTRSNLRRMLQAFPFVYIKPNDSAQGKGIFRVDVRPDGSYMLRSRDTDEALFIKDFNPLWVNLNRFKHRRFYIIQQGISSITRAGNPFDIRVHVTRVNGKWVIAGIVSRLANIESIVTNYFREGPSTNVSTLLTEHLHLSSTVSERIIRKLKAVSLKSAKAISTVYPRWSEFGLDIGIDANNKLWIYEINITPGANVFQKLNYKSFLRILHLRQRAR